MSRDLDRRRGSASVELALVVPILILFVLGGLHFGRVFFFKHRLSEETRDVTRAAAVRRDASFGYLDELSPWIEGRIQARIGDACVEPPTVTVQLLPAAPPDLAERLEVTVSCKPRRILAGVGPSEIVAQSSAVVRPALTVP